MRESSKCKYYTKPTARTMVVAARAASVIKPMATFDVGMNVTQIIYFF